MEDFITEKPPEDFISGEKGPMAPGNAIAMNPMDAPDEMVSDEEQAQYNDLFNRVMAFVYDDREANGTKAPAEAVIDAINVGNAPIEETLGTTAGNIMVQFHNAAKRQGVEYSGDVLREVGSDLVVELIVIAESAGVLTGEGFTDDDDAPFTDQEADLHMKAVLKAVQVFGNYLKSSGQLTPQKQDEAKQELFAQIEREQAAGELDDMPLDQEQEQLMSGVMGQGINIPGAQNGPP